MKQLSFALPPPRYKAGDFVQAVPSGRYGVVREVHARNPPRYIVEFYYGYNKLRERVTVISDPITAETLRPVDEFEFTVQSSRLFWG